MHRSRHLTLRVRSNPCGEVPPRPLTLEEQRASRVSRLLRITWMLPMSMNSTCTHGPRRGQTGLGSLAVIEGVLTCEIELYLACLP
jgi:hypothetical protein